MLTIPEKQARYFLNLYMDLLSSACLFNKKISRKVEKDRYQSEGDFLLECREKILENPEYFDRYSEIADLSKRKKKILQKIKGSFIKQSYIVAEYTNTHVVLLPHSNEKNISNVIYVKNLLDPLSKLVPNQPPFPISAVIFPYDMYIIMDGLIETARIIIGENMASGIKEDLKKSKEEGLIIDTVEKFDEVYSSN